MSTVSIIVPIYNADVFLPMCLTSLTHQTHSNIEILLINDGSTDDSLEICKQFAQTDKRIIVTSQHNQGQSEARNRGLTQATGEYVIFVDADDYLDSDFVEQHLRAIGDTDYVQSGYRRLSIYGDILEEKLPRHRYQFTSPCMRMYRTDFLRKHNLSFPTGMIYEDVIFSLHLWESLPRTCLMKYCGYNYTLNPSSTTSQPHRESQRQLICAIRQSHAQWWLKLLTILRLKVHFLKYR